MPSINEVIVAVDKIKANDYDAATKARWLIELDGRLDAELFHGALGTPPGLYPEDGDLPLLVQPPYDNLYEHYICAMIDFFRREIDNYENSMAMFSAAEEEFRKWYRRNHLPESRSYTNIF